MKTTNLKINIKIYIKHILRTLLCKKCLSNCLRIVVKLMNLDLQIGGNKIKAFIFYLKTGLHLSQFELPSSC